MDIVMIFNGLGNQMSQYAFYLEKKKVAKTIPLFYNSKLNHNGYELEKLFGLKVQRRRGLVFLFKLLNHKKFPFNFILFLLAKLRLIRFYNEDTDSYDFDEKFLKKGDCLLNFYWGGWHSFKYLESNRDILHSIYSFRLSVGNQNVEIINEMKKSNSVSIHIRRGDYLNKGNEKWGNVVGIGYYQKAIQMINEKYINDELHFYVFSDDYDWVKENLRLDNMTLINWNKKQNSWIDMYLMSLCKVNIIPNSTFSWWAGWLNANQNHLVICPDRFIINHTSKDFYPDEWVKIKKEN